MFGSRAVLILVSVTGAANENGKVAEDSETIPDQTPAEGGGAKPADEPAAAATSAGTSAPAGEEPQPAEASPPAEAAAAPAEAPAAADSAAETAAGSSEPAAAAPEQGRLESKPALFATL